MRALIRSGFDLGYPVFLEHIIDVDGRFFVDANCRDTNLHGVVEVYGGESFSDEVAESKGNVSVQEDVAEDLEPIHLLLVCELDTKALWVRIRCGLIAPFGIKYEIGLG